MALRKGVSFLLLLLVVVCTLGAEGKKFSAALFGDNKIVGGIRAKKYAFMVALLDATDEDFVCGGSAIDEWTVLSAGHCVDSLKLENARVRAGSVFYLIGGVVHEVATMTKHPKHNPKNGDYDAAVLKLKKALAKSVTPIALPRTVRPKDGTRLTTVGWGWLAFDQKSDKPTDRLMQTALRVLPQAQCAAMYKNETRAVTARMICAAAPGTDDCKGDSGGPLFDESSNTIYGIVSWGKECANKDYPGVFTDLTYKAINSWAKSMMGHKK